MFSGGLTATLLGPLDYMFGETFQAALVAAAVLAFVFAVLARFNAWSFGRATRNWLLITSLFAIVLFTQWSPYTGHGHILDLTPFSDVKAARYSDHRRDLFLANIALFVPLGLALAWRHVRFVRAMAVGIGLSTACEALQYVMGNGRIAQIDDVIFNSSGALLGWLGAAIWLRAFRLGRKPEAASARAVERV